MPPKLPHPCNYPGCPELTTERFCPLHKTIASREYDRFRRPPGSSQTYGYQWRKRRSLYISRHPLCELCEAAGRLTPATVVHHRIPVDQSGSDHEDNLQSLCVSCHNGLTVTSTNRDLG